MYGLKYTCKFDPISDKVDVYTLEISEKGYSGQVFEVVGGGVPVLHRWETDDPKAPIKGSSLDITLINSGNLPLSSFFSSEDDTFKVRLKAYTQILFEGFLVQDDCSEIMVDFSHEINLSANDNLGLLKDVSLDKANLYKLFFTSDNGFINTYVDDNTVLLGNFGAFPGDYIQIGDRVKIMTGPAMGTYTVNNTTEGSGYLLLNVDEPVNLDTFELTTYEVYKPTSLFDKVPLITIIRMCLSVTGIELQTRIYTGITEVLQNPNSDFLSQTLIDPQTFLSSDTEYMDCYTILEMILERFKMSLFQAKGLWILVRWDELRYYNNQIKGFIYDTDWNKIADDQLVVPTLTGPDEDIKPETGLIHKLVRNYSHVKETFNYEYPNQLLRNYNFTILGSEIRSYTEGSGVELKRIKEYNCPWWYSGYVRGMSTGSAVYFIRVIRDFRDNEIERYLVIKNWIVMSFPIEANKDDGFIFSFSARSTQSKTGVPIGTGLRIDNGTDPVLTLAGGSQDGEVFQSWQPTSNQWSLYLSQNENIKDWHTVSVDTGVDRIPIDGILKVYLPYFCDPGYECHFKDLRLEYFFRVNDSTKIIGQTHKSTQRGNIKNLEDEEIQIDSSPRNSISGTLFLNQKEGLLQKRTERWDQENGLQNVRLGEITTFEHLYWRRVPRSILEGTLYGIINATNYISLLSIIKYSKLPNLNFVFGTLEIDYKNDHCNGTLWEMWKDEEQDDDLNSKYEFEYLYSTE